MENISRAGQASRRGRLPAPVLLLAALLGTLLLQVVLTSPPAAAHAMVESTTPGEDARLETAPTEVRIRFDEHVSLGAGYLRVIAPGGARADTGAAEVADTTVSVGLRSGLPDASYVVTYRVVSADSHPVSGAFSFVVGDGALTPATATAAGDATDPLVAVALPLARWVGYAGLVLGLGVPLFLLLVWPGGWSAPLLRRLSGAGLAAVAAGGTASFLLQGPYAGGVGLGSVLDPDLLSATAGSTYGTTVLARLVLCLVAALVLLPCWRARRAPGAGSTAAVAVASLALLLTVAGVGHPVAGRLPVLEVIVTLVHVAAMTVWLGGLTTLVAAVLRPGTSAADLVAVLPRWSRLAFGVVTALVLTGVVQSIREVRTPGALVHTTYGWVLIAKVAVVLVVLAVAALSRDWVQQQLGGRPAGRSRRGRSRRTVLAQAFAAGPAPDAAALPDGPAAAELAGQPPTVGVLRRWVLVEAAGAVVVLALSAVLVGLPPAQAAVARPVEVTLPLRSATGTAGNGSVRIELEPATTGTNTADLYLVDAAGQLTQPQQISVSLTEREQQIGPLPVELAAAGPGHYTADPDLPTAGTWTLTVTVRLDEFTAVTASTVFPVR